VYDTGRHDDGADGDPGGDGRGGRARLRHGLIVQEMMEGLLESALTGQAVKFSAQEVRMGKTTATEANQDMTAAVRPELLRLLDTLPPAKQIQVLDFARFLHQQMSVTESAQVSYPRLELHAAPTATLVGLTGLVALGGDAMVDTEALYDGMAGEH
jgi:hypothetical protein